MQSREGAAEIRVIFSGLSLDGGAIRQRFSDLAFRSHRVRGAGIGEEHDAQVETGFFSSQRGIVEFPLALLIRQVGFDHISVRHFPAGLEFLCQVDKGFGFVEGALGDVHLLVSREHAEVSSHDAHHQVPAGTLEVGRGLGGQRAGALIVGDAGEAEGFIDEDLCGVFPDRVVGDEARRSLGTNLSCLIANAIGLRVEILAVRVGVGQQGAAAEGRVQPSRSAGGNGACIG